MEKSLEAAAEFDHNQSLKFKSLNQEVIIL